MWPAKPVWRLVTSWDDSAIFREQLRRHSTLLMLPAPDASGAPIAPPVGAGIPKSIQVARCNMEVLVPVFQLMSEEPGLKLPIIDMILESAGMIYQKHRLQVETCKVYRDAWGIRRLAQLVKSRLYKSHPPQEPVTKSYNMLT